MEIQSSYRKAIRFATLKHVEKNQFVPGTKMPYVVHLSNVAMEIFIAAQHSSNFNLQFAVQVALLHDTIEDTNTTLDELIVNFDPEIANGVLALTKNKNLPKAEQMTDSLKRIINSKNEVWAVKLADRISNLQEPPKHWDKLKITNYLKEAELILEKLKGGNQYLENRLKMKVEQYENYIE